MSTVRRTIVGAKFVGTVSLGLLTGLSYSNTTLTLPALLSLPSAITAHTAFAHLRSLSNLHSTTLTFLATTSLLIAYTLSPSRGRHPYLVWVSLLTGAGTTAVDWVLLQGEKAAAEKQDGGARKVRAVNVNDEDSEDYDHEEEEGHASNVNGEQVRGAVERFRKAEAWRTGVAGVAFAMGVIGIWGDGF